MASPFLLGLFGISAGTVVGILCVVFGALLVLAVLTGASFVVGVVVAILGVICLVISPLDAMFLFGLALVGVGCGLIGVVILFFIFRLFPLCFRGIKKLGHSISRKQEGGDQV